MREAQGTQRLTPFFRTAKDRRLVIVHITPVGIDLLAQLDQPVLDLHRGQMQHMTRAELAELNRLLEKLRRPATEAVVSVREKARSR